jgi:hypothetical protein
MAKRKKKERIDLLGEIEKSYRRMTLPDGTTQMDHLFVNKPETALKIWASLVPKQAEVKVEHNLNYVQIPMKSSMPKSLPEEIIDIEVIEA